MVDDNVSFRTDLKRFIESDQNYKVIAEASDGKAFLELTNIPTADIILMDIAMDRMDGIEATRRAFWVYSYLKIIAVTMHSEKIYLIQLIETGFKGCVFKFDVYNQLKEAIEKVLKGNLYIPKNIPIDKKDHLSSF
jgi:DNA-binding NarL/FixJ family response regulator